LREGAQLGAGLDREEEIAQAAATVFISCQRTRDKRQNGHHRHKGTRFLGSVSHCRQGEGTASCSATRRVVPARKVYKRSRKDGPKTFVRPDQNQARVPSGSSNTPLRPRIFYDRNNPFAPRRHSLQYSLHPHAFSGAPRAAVRGIHASSNSSGRSLGPSGDLHKEARSARLGQSRETGETSQNVSVVFSRCSPSHFEKTDGPKRSLSGE